MGLRPLNSGSGDHNPPRFKKTKNQFDGKPSQSTEGGFFSSYDVKNRTATGVYFANDNQDDSKYKGESRSFKA